MKFKIKIIFGIWNLEFGIAVSVFVLLLSSCTGPQVRQETAVNNIPSEVRQDLTVSGTIKIKGEVKVFSGATLTVKPGTRFLFEPFDPDNDGVNDSRLLIEGILVARGDPDAPIYFSSAAPDPEPGDWLEVGIERSEGTMLEYCVLEHSRYGLHVHFSSGVVANSIFRDNIDGTRFGNSRFRMINNLIEGNIGKGINLRKSEIVIDANKIFNNRHGIFLFEEDSASYIEDNLFDGNTGSDIRFGDFYKGDAPLFFGNSGSGEGSLKVIGREGTNASGKFSDLNLIGPKVTEPVVNLEWQTEIGSFIDAGIVALDRERAAVASWEEGISVIDIRDGRIIWQTEIGDVVDATPILERDALYFPSWNRKFFRIDAKDGEILSVLEWPSSLADDHRQAGPVSVFMSLIQGLWNGDLWAIRPWDMTVRWKVALDGTVRGAVAVDELSTDRPSIWVGTEGGFLYHIDYNGNILLKIDAGGAVKAPVIMFDRLYPAVITTEGILKVYGREGWMWTRKLPGPGTYAPPVSFGKDLTPLLAAADGSGNVSVFDQRGALLWQVSLGSAVHCLSVYKGILWAGTQNDGLFALDSATGRILYLFEAGGAVHSAPAHLRKQGAVFKETPEKSMELVREWPSIIAWGARDGVARTHSIMVRQKPWEPPTP